MKSEQDIEVDRNYDAFQRMLGGLLNEYRGQYALMHARRLIGIFDNPGDAYRAGIRQFSGGIFSIQEVTDEPIDLGLWSHVQH